MAVADYIQLMKLRIDALLLLVAAAGYVATSGPQVDPTRFGLLMTSGLLAAAGASATNHYLDRDLDSLMRRTEDISTNLTRSTEALTDKLATRTQELTEVMIDTGSRLAETIATRADEVNNTLKATGESLVLDLTLRGGDVVSKLEETGTRITETIVTRGGKVTDTFRDSADTLAQALAAKLQRAGT